jgi:cyanate permease
MEKAASLSMRPQFSHSLLGVGLDVLIKDNGVSNCAMGLTRYAPLQPFAGAVPMQESMAAETLGRTRGVEGSILALSVGLPRRLRSGVMPFAYAHRPSSFEVN